MKNLSVETQQNFLSLKGALRSADAIKFKPELIARIQASNGSFTLDISKVNNIDITGLNSLLIAKKYSKRTGKDLTILAREGNPIFELVHLTKFRNFIDITIV